MSGSGFLERVEEEEKEARAPGSLGTGWGWDVLAQGLGALTAQGAGLSPQLVYHHHRDRWMPEGPRPHLPTKTPARPQQVRGPGEGTRGQGAASPCVPRTRAPAQSPCACMCTCVSVCMHVKVCAGVHPPHHGPSVSDPGLSVFHWPSLSVSLSPKLDLCLYLRTSLHSPPPAPCLPAPAAHQGQGGGVTQHLLPPAPVNPCLAAPKMAMAAERCPQWMVSLDRGAMSGGGGLHRKPGRD